MPAPTPTTAQRPAPAAASGSARGSGGRAQRRMATAHIRKPLVSETRGLRVGTRGLRMRAAALPRALALGFWGG